MSQASTTNMHSSIEMAKAIPEKSAQIEARARRMWVGIIVFLLGLQVIGGIVTVYLATNDPTSAVIPNYYQAGLNWDIKRRNLDQFTTLGWHVMVDVQAADIDLNQRQITIHLKKNDAFVGNQRVSAAVYHHARGNKVIKINFDEALEGHYVATCRLTQAGLWQFDISIEGDHGVAETRFTMNVIDGGSTNYRFPELPEQTLKS